MPVEDSPQPRLSANAWYLGERIEARQLERGETLALAPLTLRAGDRGWAVIFRFGAVVFLDVDALSQAAFIERLAPFVRGRFEEPANEAVEVAVDPERGDQVDASGTLVLRVVDTSRVQVVAHALAKSAVLSHYEGRVAGVFDRIERLAAGLGRGASPARGGDLLREIGSVLLIQTSTVGRVEITEKPEITWDSSELDRLYERLAAEFELRDRDVALSRKLELVSRTAETYLDLLTNRRSIRVEWYIVILIVVEIILTLYQMAARA
jgi:required for meiotic nuclear division protein 1